MCRTVREIELASLHYLFQEQNIISPCFIIDETILKYNMNIIDDIQKYTHTKILLALKAYSAWQTFPILSQKYGGPLWGVCASSVDEARLGREEFGGEVHAFAAAWNEDEINNLLHLADFIVFNSLNQWRRFKSLALNANNTFRKSTPVSFGLRVNPEHSEGAPEIYDPCSPASRLGIRKKELEFANKDDLEGISGLHFHTLCEQNSDALQRTLDKFEKNFTPWFNDLQWLNFGGGHHITRADYDINLLKTLLQQWHNKTGTQIYLEPGEAIALNAGWLVTTILDIVETDIQTIILDTSAACHMPDVLEMPYTPDVWYKSKDNKNILKADQSGKSKNRYRLTGKSCLAGDIIGEYSFDRPLKIGDRLIFADMAIYSMVKTTTFNGLRLPSIGILKRFDNTYHIDLIRKFSYEDFKNRLG